VAKTTFSPTAIVDGETVTPEGWMWVLAFALKGIEWAVEKAEDPEYDLRGKMADYEKRKNDYQLTNHMKRLEKELARVKKELGIE